MQRLALLDTKSGKNRKKLRLAAQAALGCGVVAGLSLTPGCNLVNPPQPEPTPTTVPTPKPDLFDPKDGVTPLVPLNDNNPAASLTDKFRVVGIPSGELLQLQSLTGAPGQYVGGTADLYRLAGIVTPTQGQPGYAETVRFIAERTLGAGNEVDVEQDPRFPQDLDARRMVQVFYTPTAGSRKGEKLLLNRMMVRQGFAVVDINAPTSIDVRAWLNDEEFARKKRLGLNALGITIAQRIPLGTPGGVIRTPAERIPPPRGIRVRPGQRPGSRPVQRPGQRTTTTTSTVIAPGGPPRGPGGPPPGSTGGPGPGGRPNGRPGGPSPGSMGGAPPSVSPDGPPAGPSVGASNSAGGPP